MESLRDIGQALVAVRRSHGISQAELASTLGVKQQQVARWESSAYRTTSLDRVAAVAEALGYSLIEFGPGSLMAAEEPAEYGVAEAVRPVRDLGEVIARIREHGDELRDRYHLSRVAVFGSFVVGEQHTESDVDLLVEFSERPRGFAYMEPPQFLEDVLGRDVDMVEARLLRDRLRPRVLKEAVDVWQA